MIAPWAGTRAVLGVFVVVVFWPVFGSSLMDWIQRPYDDLHYSYRILVLKRLRTAFLCWR